MSLFFRNTGSGHTNYPPLTNCIDPEFSSTVVADERLGLTSDLTRGCGSVAIVSRKTLKISDLHKDGVDRKLFELSAVMLVFK